jgi:hypothetical protein
VSIPSSAGGKTVRRSKGNFDSLKLNNLARRWISLWCVPADWKLFDRLHSDDFEDGSPAGRESSVFRGLRFLRFMKAESAAAGESGMEEKKFEIPVINF